MPLKSKLQVQPQRSPACRTASPSPHPAVPCLIYRSWHPSPAHSGGGRSRRSRTCARRCGCCFAANLVGVAFTVFFSSCHGHSALWRTSWRTGQQALWLGGVHMIGRSLHGLAVSGGGFCHEWFVADRTHLCCSTLPTQALAAPPPPTPTPPPVGAHAQPALASVRMRLHSCAARPCTCAHVLALMRSSPVSLCPLLLQVGLVDYQRNRSRQFILFAARKPGGGQA